MKKRFSIPFIVIAILGATALIVFLFTTQFDTTLEFQVQDIVSKNWVWDATITLQNRTIRSYYQSDRGPRVYRFTHMEPGVANLEISASAYQSISIPITLKKGKNIITEPIEMVGLKIPELSYFIIFEDLIGTDILCEIRPVGHEGHAVLNHPAMDLWIEARVSVQMKDGLMVKEGTDEGSVRGEELFSSKIEWAWDAAPETLFRYSARIPGAKIKKSLAPYRVIDYLLIVPHPQNSSRDEIGEIVREVWKYIDPVLLEEYLEQYSDKFDYYIHSSWNVEAEA